MFSYVITFTTLEINTQEKNKASKKDVTPEHKLEVSGSQLERRVGGTENMSNSAKNFFTVFIPYEYLQSHFVQSQVNFFFEFNLRILFPFVRLTNSNFNHVIIRRYQLTPQIYLDIKMANLEKNKTLLENYIYNPSKPFFSSGNYQIHQAKQKQTKLPVTIKILKGFSPDLLRYLKKLRDCKSDNTIRIYELFEDSASIVMVSQHVSHGNLSNALSRCQRLDEPDAISIAKMLLNGYVDLLRLDCTWVGTEKDIEFTESGIKLSWNNFTSFKAQGCIVKVLEKLSNRDETQSSILIFPKSKIMDQLIKVSKQSASQISLNPNLKKKQKGIRKKSKNWTALREVSTKNQYMEQSTYLAVDLEYGFVRVKIFDKGAISQQLLTLNKTKASFTKVLDSYEQNGKTIIISEYSNDGNLQNYVAKLKNTKAKLTEEHIEFFFFSLFEPLKQVQDSALKCIGMLHIRNIYLQNGIPKIGEPVPINEKLIATLKEREDVPDFYHPRFKKDPTSKSDTYDTYSLGVLLYKLMYTEYPIFPEGKVHIPTAPSYNKRLKTTLEILLNEGGNLKSLESKIEVSETVKNQVKQNKAILEVINIKDQRKSSVELTKRALIEDLEQTEDNNKNEHKSEQKSEDAEEFDDEHNCCSLCCHALEFTSHEQATNRFVRVTSLEESPYKVYRSCTKIIFIVLFYSLVFYYFFLQANFNFLSSQSSLKSFNVTIATVNYPIIISSQQTFETQFNKTSRNVAALQSLNCLIDGYNGNPTYSDFVVTKSSGWVFFVVAGLLMYIVFMGIKAWMCFNFDLVKAVYNWDHGKFNFNLSNFIVFNLLFCCLLNGHYYLFNFIFNGQLSPCLGSQYYYSSSDTLFNNINKFLFPYMTTFIFQFAVVLAHWIMIWRTHSVSYNKLINPIIIFCPFLITQWINLRIGPINGYFIPNGLQENSVLKSYFVNLQYIGMLGTVPEILWIGELLLGFIIDSIYWCFLDKRRRILIHDSSAASLTEMIK